MKKTELMIGDWVQSEQLVAPARYSGFFRHYPAPISGKPYTRLECLYEGDREGGEVPEDKVMPISLTPEILEKNGWEKKGSPYEWRDNIWVQKWNLPIDTGNFQILDCPNYDGFTWNNIELKFVHTLQHALRLCGLNELADNFKI